MFARSTTVQAHRGSLDRGIALVRDELLPAVLDTEGCIGMSLLADRDSGRCIATTAWESRAAMSDSAGMIRPMRDRAADTMGGTAQVDEWEIALLHRDHTSSPGACARVTWLRMDPSRMEQGTTMFRDEVLPEMEQMVGFCSASLMLDPTEGYAAASFAFDSAEAMAATRDRALRMRAGTAAELNAQILEVGEFELVMAHLRVPELV
ncbi:antibiotic biosynthesis monooxygenase [Pseudonocardia pini]|uniref:antibiotic biosynthesis monooxygenase n=1 Tax=Pseudonocardia pini TaxID=2758030 RepID=UPI0015F0F72A|nr:antibiotic biosynthesis monooxygenase [Pseudonocardia pini]